MKIHAYNLPPYFECIPKDCRFMSLAEFIPVLLDREIQKLFFGLLDVNNWLILSNNKQMSHFSQRVQLYQVNATWVTIYI